MEEKKRENASEDPDSSPVELKNGKKICCQEHAKSRSSIIYKPGLLSVS
jgi:hypothetical protein